LQGQRDEWARIRAGVEARRDYWRERANRSDEDSMVGRRYVAYADAHEADLAAIDAAPQDEKGAS
jgi:hypothetical protein